jgi:hypothetical protein
VNQIRIIEHKRQPGERISVFTWPARPGPPPLKPKSQIYAEKNRNLENDRRGWAERAKANGL